MILLLGGKGIHDSIDRRRGAVGVQRAHDQDAHFGRRDGDTDGLEVAHFADQDHVRVLTQPGVQGFGEAPGVCRPISR